jgi:hypothetical protein
MPAKATPLSIPGIAPAGGSRSTGGGVELYRPFAVRRDSVAVDSACRGATAAQRPGISIFCITANSAPLASALLSNSHSGI